jgi:PAS domain S-box-containing protein
MKRALFIFLLLFLGVLFPAKIHAQQSLADSLVAELSNLQDDTSKVNIYNDLFRELMLTNPDSALTYANQAFELSSKISFQRGIASSYNNIGLALFNKGEANDALSNYLKALEIFVEIGYKKGASITLANIGNLFYSQGNYNKTLEYYLQSLIYAQQCNDKQRSAMLLGNIGIVYYAQGFYAKALTYYLKSLSIREEISDKQGIAYALESIALIYDAQHNYKKSLEYYEKSLRIKQKIGDKKGIASSLNNIGNVYNDQKEYSKALEYFQQALALAKEIDYKKVIASSLNNIGDTYQKQGNYAKASEYYLKTLAIDKELGDKSGIATSLNNIGEVLKKKGSYSNALTYFMQSLDVSKEIEINEITRDNYQKIAETYALMNNYTQAYEYQKLFSEITDTIYNKESLQQLTDLQAKFETEQKEKEIQLLKKDSEVQTLKLGRNTILVYSLVGGFILIIVLVSFIFNNYRHKQQLKQLNADIALRESEEKYRDLANLLPQVMFEVDNNNQLSFLNTAGTELTGYSMHDISNGLGFTAMFVPEDSERLQANLNQIFSGNIINGLEYTASKKNGLTFPVLCYFSPFVDKDKNTGIRGIAIDITELRQIERKMLGKIIETEEKERKRIAKDLHDGLGPLLSSIKLYVNEIQSDETELHEKADLIKYTNELIDDAVSSTRTIANNLMPGIIADYGLLKALQSFCNKINISRSLNIVFNAPEEIKRYDSTIEITLYRVLMELINNTLKHAQASNISINFAETGNNLIVEYSDDGIGFNITEKLNDPKSGLGLNNIISRIKSVYGTCDFQSKPGQGTKVKIEIDLRLSR